MAERGGVAVEVMGTRVLCGDVQSGSGVKRIATRASRRRASFQAGAELNGDVFHGSRQLSVRQREQIDGTGRAAIAGGCEPNGEKGLHCPLKLNAKCRSYPVDFSSEILQR